VVLKGLLESFLVFCRRQYLFVFPQFTAPDGRSDTRVTTNLFGRVALIGNRDLGPGDNCARGVSDHPLDAASGDCGLGAYDNGKLEERQLWERSKTQCNMPATI
jgi:hypothetical protein